MFLGRTYGMTHAAYLATRPTPAYQGLAVLRTDGWPELRAVQYVEQFLDLVKVFPKVL